MNIYLKNYKFLVRKRNKITKKKSEYYLLLLSENKKDKADYISSLYQVANGYYVFDTCIIELRKYEFYNKYFKVNLDDPKAIEITRAEYQELKNMGLSA